MSDIERWHVSRPKTTSPQTPDPITSSAIATSITRTAYATTLERYRLVAQLDERVGRLLSARWVANGQKTRAPAIGLEESARLPVPQLGGATGTCREDLAVRDPARREQSTDALVELGNEAGGFQRCCICGTRDTRRDCPPRA